VSDTTINLRTGGQFDDENPAAMWFGVELERFGWANLYLGTEEGSVPVCQTLRISLSDTWNPFPNLAELAEHAANGNLPYSFEIDSEGPESVLTLRTVDDSDHSIFEIHSLCFPVIYFAAIVDARQMGLALAYALQVAIRDEDHAGKWKEWRSGATNGIANYFGNTWLRDTSIEPADLR
jgi:hypothetical protein